MKKQIKSLKEEIKILGIDPGTATTGWAIISEKNGNLKPLAYGHISTCKEKCDSERIFEISEDLKEIINKHKPCEAAIEDLFFFKNKKTVIKVSEVRGAILLTLSQKNVKISNYTPLQVKQALTGYGRAEKKQIQLITKEILKLKKLPKPDDTADAIAIAICHINSRKLNNLNNK